MRVLLINAKASLARAIVARTDLEAIVLAEPRYRRDFESCDCGPAIADVPYLSGGKLSPRAIRSVGAAIRRLRPDVVHAFYGRALAHTVLAAAGMRDSSRPRIVSYRGVTARASWWNPVERITYLSRRVDAHACESDAVRQSLVASGAADDRCSVVFNCLTCPLESCDRTEARRAWGVPDDAFVVAMTANMRRVKGADVLVQAALSCDDLRDMHFVLMGRVEDNSVARLAAGSRARRVHLAGYRPDAARLVSAADVFVMPSRAEALSVALLEAMSHGVCPVVSDAGGMKEAVRHAHDGLVFPSGDATALARHLRALHADSEGRRRLARSARRRAATEFSAAAVADRLATLYRAVLAGTAMGAEPKQSLRRIA